MTQFLHGARDSLPLVLAATPFGIVFGAMGQAAGLSDWIILAFSVFVFAGSSQFVAMTLITSGASTLLIILTTWVINLRHMLYGVSLIPSARRLPKKTRAVMGFFLTDETYATVINHIGRTQNQEINLSYFFGSGVFMYLNWIISTYVGIVAGHQFPQLTSFGLDIAMVVAFTGIVIANVRLPGHWVCAFIATISGILTFHWPHKTGLLFSSFIAIIAGFYTDLYLLKRGQSND